jgi:2-haloacid dehalogenase
MKYKTLLFDVDDTLLDFQASEHKALAKIFNDAGVVFTPALKAQYQTYNHQLWQNFEAGKVSRDEIINGRFGDFFHALGKPVDSLTFATKYRQYLNEGHDLLGDSREIVASLAKTHDLYVVTNGVAETQYQRLHDSGLMPFFKDIFVSEDTGYHKPEKEFFEIVFAKIPEIDLAQTVIIGDSLTSDIQGGINAGIDTVWLKHGDLASTITPTYEIHDLSELDPIVD